MRNHELIFVPLIFLSLNSFAQEFGEVVYHRTSKEILKQIPQKEDRYTDRKLFNPIYELLCIGEYATSIYHYDKINSYPQFSFIDSIEHSNDLIDYKAFSAKDYILEKAKNNQITVFNENHNQPLNRFFVHTLLKDFYKLGYRYLALEALFTDNVINKNGYPLLTDGFYISEPQFANMIREACRLGFKLVRYEALGSQFKNREFSQALNIKQEVLVKDPLAKIIIYCGYGHGKESALDTSKMMMGAQLKKLTGIDPFTIEQEFLTNHPDHNYDPSVYGSIYANHSSIFLHKTSESKFVPFGGDSSYDAVVYHPPVNYQQNRPNWLFNENIYKSHIIEKEKITISYPVLIMAYVANEKGNYLIPFDCVELKSKKDNKNLALKGGDYKLVIRNDKNEEQTFNITIDK